MISRLKYELQTDKPFQPFTGDGENHLVLSEFNFVMFDHNLQSPIERYGISSLRISQQMQTHFTERAGCMLSATCTASCTPSWRIAYLSKSLITLKRQSCMSLPEVRKRFSHSLTSLVELKRARIYLANY